MKIHEYRSTSGWKTVSNRVGNYPDESYLSYYYKSGNKNYISYAYTNQAAGITIPAKPNTNYKIVLNGNISALNTNASGYFYYLHTAWEAYDAATSSYTVSSGVQDPDNIVRTYDSTTNKTTFTFKTKNVSSLKCINFTTSSSIYYGTSNPAYSALFNLYDSISEETPAGWQDIDPNKRVSGAWTTGSAHKRSSGTWD